MIALFCDVSNLYHCVNKKYERKLDYLKLFESVQGEDVIYKAYAYGYRINDSTQGFMTCLKHYGYEPKFRKKGKDSWLMAIACDVFRVVSKVDRIVFGSNDPNLLPLIQLLQEKGVKVVIHACGISKLMRSAADEWIEISSDLLEDSNVK